MDRSKYGLSAAGEWHQLEKLFPDVNGKIVLDLGCGYGWHSKYCAEHGAASVLGIDASERMIAEARERNSDPAIAYKICALDEYDYPAENYDFVLSNLVLHYIDDLGKIYQKVHNTLKPGGIFLFNIEHPTFTAAPGQDWIYQDGKPVYWPVDQYFYPGERETAFLGWSVKKYHHTLTQILVGLMDCGFELEAVEEAMPSEEMIPLMPDEMRRPMMLLVRGMKR
ncbi:MAG: class I SAM-dependent methyltransferase [Oscillospiraceae bacterium]|nr:class I SAM-dependent methyltransferase [Oscillospiraceae bacterium]